MVKILNRLTRFSVESEDVRERYQMYYIFLIVSFVLLIMTILNIITGKEHLLVSTASGALAISALSLYIRYCDYNIRLVIAASTAILLLMSGYFIIYGGASGFSVIWTLLMPSATMILFGIKVGSHITGGILVQLIFFFYIPYGQSFLQYDYTQEFLMRFPIAFFSAYLISLYLEYERRTVYDELYNEKERYYELSRRDALTGIYNRVGFNELAEKCVTKYLNKPVALLIADIDYFKNVNDEYGHAVGDEVLKQLTDRMKIIFKDNDNICRWGGEEFAILLFENDAKAYEKLADNLRKKIEHKPFTVGDIKVDMTLSIGCAYTNELKEKQNEELFIMADDCLYDAKSQGRNQVISKVIEKAL